MAGEKQKQRFLAPGSTSYCLIAIVCRLLCLKLKTCGRRLSWRDIQHIQKVAFQRRTHCRLSHDFAQIHGFCTRMGQGALVVTEPHAELNAGLIVIFRSSHPPLFVACLVTPLQQFPLMRNSRTKPPIWLRPSGTELVSFSCVRALPVSLALMRRRSGFNLVWRFRL